MKSEKIDCTLLSSVAKPYNFEGKSGISYKATFLVVDKLLIVKISEDQYNEYKDLKSQAGYLVLDLSIYDGKLTAKVSDFSWE